MKLSRAVTLAAAAVVVVIGWTQRHRLVGADVGSPMPPYTAKQLDGGDLAIESLKGRVVLLNVWATWCRPCLREMPALERLHRQLKDEGLEVVAVSVDRPFGQAEGGDVREFVDYYGLTFRILLDPDREINRLLPVIGYPASFVIDRDGRIVHKIMGAREWDDAEHVAMIRELLAGS